VGFKDPDAPRWDQHPVTGLRMACGHGDPWVRHDDAGRPFCVLCVCMPRTDAAARRVDRSGEQREQGQLSFGALDQ